MGAGDGDSRPLSGSAGGPLVSGLRAFLSRLRGSFGGAKQDRELAEELESHIQMDADELMKSGATEEEARRRAIVRLGGVDPTRERWRDRRGFPVLVELRQDLRDAVRTLKRNPGFAAVTVLTLALGIGGSTAIFTIVHGVLIARLPFRDPDRLVVLWEENADRPGRRNTIGPANFIRWTERAEVFSDMTALYDSRVSLTGRARPEELVAQYVTASFFRTLGVEPMLGRGFAPDEGPDGHDAVTVISWGSWQRLFGGDPAIVGKSVVLDGQPMEVIGVAPRGVRLLPEVRFSRRQAAGSLAPFRPEPRRARRSGRAIHVRIRAAEGWRVARPGAEPDVGDRGPARDGVAAFRRGVDGPGLSDSGRGFG